MSAAEPQFMRSHDLWPAARSRDGGADAAPRFRLDSGCGCERDSAREHGQSEGVVRVLRASAELETNSLLHVALQRNGRSRTSLTGQEQPFNCRRTFATNGCVSRRCRSLLVTLMVQLPAANQARRYTNRRLE